MMTIETIRADVTDANAVGRPHAARAAPASWLAALLARLARAAARRHQRLDLADLNDAQLRDIGLTRNDARREAARPFWD